MAFTSNLVGPQTPNPLNFNAFQTQKPAVPSQQSIPTAPQSSPIPKTGLVNPKALTPAPASLGSYKGVSITPGNQNQIQSQIGSINTNQTPKLAGATTTTPPVPTIPPVTTSPAIPVNAPGSSYTNSTTGLVNYGQGGNNNATVNTANAGLLGYGAGNNSTGVNQATQNLLNLENQNAQTTAGIESTPEPVEQMQGQEGVQARLYASRLANAQGALTNALTSQGQNIGALGNAASSGNTQQSQNIGALGSAGSLSQPTSQFGVLTNPETGGAISPNGGLNAAVQGGVIQGAQNSASTNEQNYQSGIAKLKAANNIEPQIVQTLANNPTLNQTPITAITNLNQWLSGQTSDPSQQQLSSQVASYINALGISPDQASAIATQKGGTLATLLKTLKDSFTASNEGSNPANMSTGASSSDPAGLGI